MPQVPLLLVLVPLLLALHTPQSAVAKHALTIFFKLLLMVPISALAYELIRYAARLPEGPQYYPDDLPTDATERFIAAEIIREKIFLLTRDEVPYSTAVLIDAFEEAEEGRPVGIRATILVERDSQKGILIGQGGRMLAAVRTSAAADIGRLLDCRVRLNLFVKVSRNWTGKKSVLRDLGLA